MAASSRSVNASWHAPFVCRRNVISVPDRPISTFMRPAERNLGIYLVQVERTAAGYGVPHERAGHNKDAPFRQRKNSVE